MRIVVTGATGNVGTSVVKALIEDPEVESVLGIARRIPEWSPPKVEWQSIDVARASLVPPLEGADALIHLAWLIQPSRDEDATRAVNVKGSQRVFKAAAVARVPRLVYASSVGAYSPGPKRDAVDESHPVDGIPTSFYSRHKAEVEAILDEIEAEHPDLSVARLRPALIFKGEAASGIRRLFAGPFLPTPLLRRSLIPIVPDIDGLRFQAVHSDDVAEAYRLAAKSDAEGAFNVAAEPVLDPAELGRLLGARPVKVPTGPLRAATALSWKARLQPTPPGWLDMAVSVPLMDTTRARSQLGWTPTRSSGEALLELIEGMRRGEGFPTPPLEPGGSGPMRLGELATGVGARSFRGAREPAGTGSG